MQHQWRDDVVKECQKDADNCVRTLGGKIRRIPLINDVDGSWAADAARKARNTVPQGSAADITKTAMNNLQAGILSKFPGKCNIVLSVSAFLQ